MVAVVMAPHLLQEKWMVLLAKHSGECKAAQLGHSSSKKLTESLSENSISYTKVQGNKGKILLQVSHERKVILTYLSALNDGFLILPSGWLFDLVRWVAQPAYFLTLGFQRKRKKNPSQNQPKLLAKTASKMNPYLRFLPLFYYSFIKHLSMGCLKGTLL